MVISICGIVCSDCPYISTGCSGCVELKGKPFWTKDMPGGICLLYDCAVNIKKFNNCGDCAELPCKLFLEFKDPSMSDEEHKASVAKRVNVLKGL